LSVVLVGQALVRWYYRRRVTHLPGFTRAAVDGVAGGSVPASARSSQQAGSGSGAIRLDAPGSQPPLVPSGS